MSVTAKTSVPLCPAHQDESNRWTDATFGMATRLLRPHLVSIGENHARSVEDRAAHAARTYDLVRSQLALITDACARGTNCGLFRAGAA